MNGTPFLILAQAGIHTTRRFLDSRLRGNEEEAALALRSSPRARQLDAHTESPALPSSRRRQLINWRDDRGFTILEVIIVILLTAILSSIFAQSITSSMEIYADQTMRKDMHSDVRRSTEMMWHDLKEFYQWQTAATGSWVNFRRYVSINNAQHATVYLGTCQEAFNATAQNTLVFQSDRDGAFANQYSLISSGITNRSTFFTVTTAGGTLRIQSYINVLVNGNPMRLLFTVFPRFQRL